MTTATIYDEGTRRPISKKTMNKLLKCLKECKKKGLILEIDL
jgi:hypothetical protein